MPQDVAPRKMPKRKSPESDRESSSNIADTGAAATDVFKKNRTAYRIREAARVSEL